ncbi:hypothetical protein CPPEL_10290 [Corynebacterium pseudopelargi]|uniref:Uncharacterized protein n=1 Tax=Corynebacterium pseudopelargi TaxID=2080757 RepID=A0A3G6IWW6_9CORY|nr:hypothetical protein CPPEL_10290 [Corynebacterium pseudopelargi]
MLGGSAAAGPWNKGVLNYVGGKIWTPFAGDLLRIRSSTPSADSHIKAQRVSFSLNAIGELEKPFSRNRKLRFGSFEKLRQC